MAQVCSSCSSADTLITQVRDKVYRGAVIQRCVIEAEAQWCHFCCPAARLAPAACPHTSHCACLPEEHMTEAVACHCGWLLVSQPHWITIRHLRQHRSREHG